MSDQAKERELIELSQSGDSRAFGELLEIQYDFIFAVSFKFCGNKENAEDLAHDICIKLSDKIHKFKFKSAFKTWLYQMILNSFRDFYRKNKNKSVNVEIEFLEIESKGISENDKVLAKEIYEKSLELPTKLKEAFLLVYTQDLNHLEASEILGCSEKTISWRVFEARKRIKKMMGGR